jgi:hypothetical protein
LQHFNNRDTVIVPELGQDVFAYSDSGSGSINSCQVMLDPVRSSIRDTGSVGHLAAQSFFPKSINSNNSSATQLTDNGIIIPCAMAGPFHDMPAADLGTLGLTLDIPVTVHRAYNPRVVTPLFSPYTSQIFPDLLTYSGVAADVLLRQGRSDYIAVVYSLTDTGVLRAEGLTLSLDDRHMRNQAFSYFIPGYLANTTGYENDSIFQTLRKVKESGFRTILVGMENPAQEMELLADAAAALDMSNGDYFWSWFGSIDPALLQTQSENVTKLLAGSAWLAPLESNLFKNENNPDNITADPFMKAWKAQDAAAVDRLNQANPLEEGQPGYFFAEADYFQTHEPEYGAGFLYDAVMATGMGACIATATANAAATAAAAAAGSANNDTDMSMMLPGMLHVQGIRAVNFTGATGRVQFGDVGGLPGARRGSTIQWGVLNLLPPLPLGQQQETQKQSERRPFVLVDRYQDGVWNQIEDFVYADGRIVPPEFLRTQPDQNYLSSGIRAVGFALMGMALLAAAVIAAWVWWHRKHRIVLAAQPHFLYLLVFGSAVSASTIMCISFDESYGWSEQSLSRACMATPWLLSLGHIITYGALFSKLWRVNKVLQFSRRKIDVRQVAWPSALLVLAALIVLSIWTAVDPLVWTRNEINEITGESIGECNSTNGSMGTFIAPLVLIMLIPTVLTMFMAWKTKDVDDVYSESSWISIMILVQLEIIVVALPMIFILRGVSTDGRYVGFAFMLWTFPMSSLTLIILPKIVSHRMSFGATPGKVASKRGGSRGEVRVSGLISGLENGIGSSNHLEDPSEIISSQSQRHFKTDEAS